MADDSAPPPAAAGPASLLAANGDVAIELLLGTLTDERRPLLGLVRADRTEAFELLRRKEVLFAGCHGAEIPLAVDGERLAFVHLVDREVGLAVRPGLRVRSVREVSRRRLASRPPTAGVRAHLDGELVREGLDPLAVHNDAIVLKSHQDVVCALARGEADVGVTTVALAGRGGLETLVLCQETYGLLVPASLLGDPRVVAVCDVAQGAVYRRRLREVKGYDTSRTGNIAYARVTTRRQARYRDTEDDRR
jgi:molybdate-binding protein